MYSKFKSEILADPRLDGNLAESPEIIKYTDVKLRISQVKRILFKKLVKYSLSVPFIVRSKSITLHEQLGENSASEAVEE